MSARQLGDIRGNPVDYPVIAYAGYYQPKGINRRPVLIAYGGLAWRVGDRKTGEPWCEIWFDIARPRLMRSRTLVRWARRMLRTAQQMGDRTVFCVRDGGRHQSDKLLALVGMKPAPGLRIFEADGGTEKPGEIWLWQASPFSDPP